MLDDFKNDIDIDKVEESVHIVVNVLEVQRGKINEEIHRITSSPAAFFFAPKRMNLQMSSGRLWY